MHLFWNPEEKRKPSAKIPRVQFDHACPNIPNKFETERDVSPLAFQKRCSGKQKRMAEFWSPPRPPSSPQAQSKMAKPSRTRDVSAFKVVGHIVRIWIIKIYFINHKTWKPSVMIHFPFFAHEIRIQFFLYSNKRCISLNSSRTCSVFQFFVFFVLVFTRPRRMGSHQYMSNLCTLKASRQRKIRP